MIMKVLTQMASKLIYERSENNVRYELQLAMRILLSLLMGIVSLPHLENTAQPSYYEKTLNELLDKIRALTMTYLI